MINTNFSLYLKKLRKDYGLTQEDLGKILNLTKGQISLYEKNVSLPKIDLIARILQYFNIPITQLINFSIRSNFYFREVVSGQPIHINSLPTSIGTEELTGLAGLIKIPDTVKTRPNTPLASTLVKYCNFMFLVPNENSELANFFYKNLDTLPFQSLENMFDYNAWCLPSQNTKFYDGYPLLYQLIWSCNKGSWLNSPIAKPATDDNILTLVLPQNDEIIRLYILPEKNGCKLHALRSPDLQVEIESWLQKEKKEQQQLAREYCLEIMHQETMYEDLVEQHSNLSVNKDNEYNLKKFLKNRGIEMDNE